MNFKDALMGLFIGDAYGVPYEFFQRNNLKMTTEDMIGYGSHEQPPGSWSDDTSMTIATMESIINKKEIDYKDIMNEFLLWINESKHTPNNEVFDIGKTTIRTLYKYHKLGGNPIEAGAKDEMANGNGALMRILPIAYYSYKKRLSDKNIIEVVSNVSSLTHGHEISFIACYIYIKYILFILEGNNLEESYTKIQELDYSMFDIDNIKLFNRIINNNISKYNKDEIKSTGYVLDTLEAVFYLVLNSTSYKEAIIKAVLLGNDTDTIAAIVGGICGLYYGYDSIPEQWRKTLIKSEYLKEKCDMFLKVL